MIHIACAAKLAWTQEDEELSRHKEFNMIKKFKPMIPEHVQCFIDAIG